ncbi:MAG: methyltransferase domain-containing protein [Clostridia bacterium]|nr:methyltransferase domain-containing protein [Clostridia bacterium]
MHGNILKCPVCSSRLIANGGSYKCKNDHCFDISKKGSVNLLLKGGAHGDDRGMLASRRDFLSAGYYEQLAQAVSEAVAKHGGTVLDMGCGEGYYSSRLADIKDARVYAFDVSKYAAAMTAARDKRITAFTASSFDIPVLSDSVDCAVSIFAPFDPYEVSRVLKTGGVLVAAYPMPEHLLELKQAIYDRVILNPDSVPEHKGFKQVDIACVRFNMHLNDSSHIQALFSMTPYAYNTPKALVSRLNVLTELDCRAEIMVVTYKKIRP